MKSLRLNPFILAWLAVGILPSLAVPASEEDDLIQVLQSGSDVPAKAEACKRLRVLGTPKSIPALAALLREEPTSHAARYALEGMPFPEATIVLREALGKTTGPARLGVIDSLGWRRDSESVALLTPLTLDPDHAVAAAAASALGRIGGSQAMAALDAARGVAEIRSVVTHGLMAGAERLITQGRNADAAAIYQSFFVPTEDESVRVAAYAGWIRASGEDALARVTSGLKGEDAAAQTAALQMAGNLRSPAATGAFVELLPRSTPALQVALLGVLRQRGDTAALPAAVAAAGSADLDVRVAAVKAIGTLGDATNVPILAEAAASTNATLQSAARDALIALHRGEVTTALMAQVPLENPAIQRELFSALTERGDRKAAPALLALARNAGNPTHDRALQALGKLADPNHFEALVHLMAEAKDPPAREDVRGVFETVIERFRDASNLEVAPIVRGISSADLETRKALLPVASLLVDPRVRESLRASLRDGDEGLRTAATRALCATRDPALIPDLLGFARQTTDANSRSQAFEGVVRLATDDAVKLPLQDRANALVEAFSMATRPQDQRAILSGAARVPHRALLDVSTRACGDPAIKAEAELACLQIARGLMSSDSAAAAPALERLATTAMDHSVQTNAQALLKNLKAR